MREERGGGRTDTRSSSRLWRPEGRDLNSTPSSDTAHLRQFSTSRHIAIGIGRGGNSPPCTVFFQEMVYLSREFWLAGLLFFWGGQPPNPPSLDVKGNDEQRGYRGQLPRNETARAGEIHTQVSGLPHGGDGEGVGGGVGKRAVDDSGGGGGGGAVWWRRDSLGDVIMQLLPLLPLPLPAPPCRDLPALCPALPCPACPALSRPAPPCSAPYTSCTCK